MFKHRASQDQNGGNEHIEPQASGGQRRHPVFDERSDERHAMVADQIIARGISDPQVIRAMRTVPRHVFMPEVCRHQAYHDKPLPIGYDQTISQPYIVAFMTSLLKLTAHSMVLEVGTGSGYQAAVCAEIAGQVYSIEIVTSLADKTAQRFNQLGYGNVHTRAGDGYSGWPQYAPFDAIIATAAAGHIPQPLIDQLKPNGRMVIPQQDPDQSQHLILITKDAQGKPIKQKILPVRFVPMTGEVEQPEKPQE